MAARREDEDVGPRFFGSPKLSEVESNGERTDESW